MSNIFFRYVAPTVFVLGLTTLGGYSAIAQQQVPAPAVSTPAAGAQPAAPTSSAPTQPASSSPVSSAPAETVSVDVSVQENPYGLKALWTGGDIVSRITLIIMALMSIGSWYVIIMKIVQQGRISAAHKEVKNKDFWQQKTLKQSADSLGTNSPYRYITENGIEAVKHHEGSLQESIDLYSWVSMSLHRSLDNIQGGLQSGLALLGTVGSTAPFVGLFGTVWGIHHALSAISIAGQATLDKVAGPVGEALIMTAIGLATAVPAVLGYNFLVRRNKVIMDQARNFTADVQCVLIGGNPQNKASQISVDKESNIG
ncbi:MotA/TolQ/ExbB proton channel family protein [Commensalibacter oyaizuii]|uniref:Biopolymer transport protein ExbB n=1 Tax=Commensalibacter oyaizuii TaxID=3043873 RepID=A0ABT6Q3N4_9PROT|nr:MotA/TolQ/ExbB proton channel family protein [Commensalibacter sp. TBRC 16381]MDI2091718.1 MotA/TolQ/ExbB proton channel family protein [Commensalibacter sp. TBRC 16381]